MQVLSLVRDTSTLRLQLLLSDADSQSVLELTFTLVQNTGEVILEGPEAIPASGDVCKRKKLGRSRVGARGALEMVVLIPVLE